MKKKIFTALFFIINFLILEAGFSFLDPEEIFVKGFDKNFLFRMYPDKKGKVASEEYSVTVETNGDGYRQKNIPKSGTKILVMGDSFTEGWGVEESEIYVEHLNRNGKNISFINAGLHGSSPLLYVIQIPYLIEKYKPDQILIQLFDNDIDDNEKLERFITFQKDGKAEKPNERFLANILTEKGYNFLKELSVYRFFSKLYKLISKEPSPILYYKIGREPKKEILDHEKSLAKFGKLSPLGEEINKKYGNQFGFYKDFKEEIWQKRFNKNLIYLKQLVEIAKNSGVEISFLYIPAKEFFAKGGILGKEKNPFIGIYERSNPFFEQINGLCRVENLQCTFVTREFFQKNPESLYFPYDAHLNKEGHKILAEILSDRFREKTLLFSQTK